MYLNLVLAALCNMLYFALHVSCSGTFPKPLSAKEERECLERIRAGDTTAKSTLIEHNLRLVAHIVKKYYAISGEQEDLISIGTIGLIKAASTFDYDKGTRFATYASKCIENAILTQRRGVRAGQIDMDSFAVPYRLPNAAADGLPPLIHCHATDDGLPRRQRRQDKFKLGFRQLLSVGPLQCLGLLFHGFALGV